jgi:RHO1 GDP-GTP exchange protein 1/2
MDLLDENRSLVHAGKLLRQPDTGFEWSGWSELFVLLFDNYRKPCSSFVFIHNVPDLFSSVVVMTKPKEKDGVTKYHVNRRVR